MSAVQYDDSGEWVGSCAVVSYARCSLQRVHAYIVSIVVVRVMVTVQHRQQWSSGGEASRGGGHCVMDDDDDDDDDFVYVDTRVILKTKQSPTRKNNAPSS